MRLVLVACITLATCSSAVDVARKDITVTGEFCGLGQYSANNSSVDATYKATVWYPTDNSTKYPVLSFAHGVLNPDPKLTYSGTISGVAKLGYIVVALDGCTVSADEWKAQVSSLVYMITKEQSLQHIIDYSSPTGVFGHSMGGASTICSASDAKSVKEAKIAAAVAMHPGVQLGPLRPLVPTLYFAGQLDTVVLPALVRSQYAICPHKVDRGYAVFKGYTHFNPQGPGSNHEIQWIGAMMDCYIKKDKAGCQKVFGSKSDKDSLCGAGQTSFCETAHGNSSLLDTLVV